MLKHEDIPQPQTPSPSAAQVRVTPEELAAAVTALQIRKEGQPGTIAIGDAVDELGLDVTPEEVLAEVQARRQAKPKKAQRLRGQHFVLALGIVGVLLGLAVDGNGLLQMSHRNDIAQPSSSLAYVTANPDLMVEDNYGRTIALNEAGDNQPVHCTFDSQASMFGQYVPYGSSWTLIKHNGKLYVRGWMLKEPSELIKSNGIDLFQERGHRPAIPVTVPLENLSASRTQGDGDNQIRAENVTLDQHAWEKW